MESGRQKLIEVAQDFWAWFTTAGPAAAKDYENPEFMSALDRKISELGDFGWEVGPRGNQLFLAISPDGDPEALVTTQLIVSHAPAVKGWSFMAARPQREWEGSFQLEREDGTTLTVEPTSWTYVLLRFPDGTFDCVLCTPNLRTEDENDRYRAAAVFLDAELGEEIRLTRIGGIECVTSMPRDLADQAGPVATLRAHLNRVLSH